MTWNVEPILLWAYSGFLMFNFSVVSSFSWFSAELNINKIVGKVRQIIADTVPLRPVTIEQLLLENVINDDELTSCFENHCGKCALILQSLIWLTEKGMLPWLWQRQWWNSVHYLSMHILVAYIGTIYGCIIVVLATESFSTIESGALLVMIRWFYFFYTS